MGWTKRQLEQAAPVGELAATLRDELGDAVWLTVRYTPQRIETVAPPG